MADYTGRDQRIRYLFQNGGGGGGTTCLYDATKINGMDAKLDEIIYLLGGGTLTGSTPPTSSQGVDGDVYVQKFPSGQLSSDGNCAIDTGIYPSAWYSVSTICKLNNASSNYDTIFGCRNGSVARYTARFKNSVSGTLDIHKSKTPSSSYDSYGSNISKTAMLADWYKLELNLGRYLENDGWKYSFQLENNYSAFPYSLALFANNNAGSAYGDFAYLDMKYFKIRDKDFKLIAYLVPALHEGTPCMYDMISGNYLTNQSTGDFTYTATADSYETVFWHKENGSWVVIG